MAGVRALDVIAGTAVVPDEPARFCGHAAGGAHQHRGVRPEQDVASRGYAWQHRLKCAPVAAVILDKDVRGSVQGPPRLKPVSRLTAELREPARQGETGPDAQVTSHGGAYPISTS